VQRAGSAARSSAAILSLVHLRDRAASDLPALVALLQRVYHGDGYPTVWPTDPGSWLAARNEYGARVVQVDAALAGHVSLGRPPTEPCGALWTAATDRPIEQLAEVTRLFTEPSVRRAGLGRLLLDRAVQAAHQQGAWPVLNVRRDGRPDAVHLYQTTGWHLVGTVPRRLGDGQDRPFDCWIGPAPRR
jgi:GNAT superfamily N-acetyltransferase